MTDADIELPSGTKLAIRDESPEAIAEAVHIIERGLSQQTPPKKKQQKGKKQAKKEKPSIKDHILDLRDSGSLANGKSLSEVSEALRRDKGLRLKSSQISKQLTELVRDGELRREGAPRKFKYFEPN